MATTQLESRSQTEVVNALVSEMDDVKQYTIEPNAKQAWTQQ